MSNKVLRLDKITKTEIGKAIGELTYKGYRGGYRLASNKGWAFDPKKKKYAVERIYSELNKDPFQVIEIAVYTFNQDTQEWDFKLEWNKILAFSEGKIKI